MLPELLLSVIILAFILEFFDVSLGMGYGTMLTPLLLLLGFDPLQVIPAVLLTNAVVGPVAGVFHHRFKNVDFGFKSRAFKILVVLVAFGVMGILIGVLIAVHLPEDILKAYIGLLVLSIGIFILLGYKKKRPFSWKKIIGLGSLAAFNKGMTGGGYGLIIVGGQILSGVLSKRAIGIATLAEGIICIAGVFAYIYVGGIANLNYSLILSLLIGSLFSVPIAVYVVKKFHPRKLRLVIGIASVIIGSVILAELFL